MTAPVWPQDMRVGEPQRCSSGRYTIGLSITDEAGEWQIVQLSQCPTPAEALARGRSIAGMGEVEKALLQLLATMEVKALRECPHLRGEGVDIGGGVVLTECPWHDEHERLDIIDGALARIRGGSE